MAKRQSYSKKLTFAYSFKPIYIFSRIFGFMPFTITFDSNGAIQTARIRMIDFIWFIISIGIHLISSIHFIMLYCHQPIPETSTTLAYGTQSIVVFRKLFNCLCIGIDMYNRHKLVEILRKINIFDENVSQY